MKILLHPLKRRDLFKIAGVAAISGPVYSITACSNNNTRTSQLDDIQLFLNITENHLTFILPRAEMGQDLATSFSMLIAEELQLPLAFIKVQFSDADPRFGNQMTVGSSSIRTWWLRLRQIGANLRELALNYTATKYSVPRSRISHQNEYLLISGDSQKKPYLTILAETPLTTQANTALRDRKDFTLIGHETVSINTADKTQGHFKYTSDLHLPDLGIEQDKHYLLNAVTIAYKEHWPRPEKAQLQAWKQEFKLDYIIELETKIANFDFRLALVGKKIWPLLKCKQAISDELKRTLTEKDIQNETVQPFDQLNRVNILKQSSTLLECSFNTPEIAHAPLETQTAIMHYQRNEVLEVWAPTQAPMLAKQSIAKELDIPLDNIILHSTAMGGSFGRKRYDDFLVEAALISHSLARHGSYDPVKLLWTREDDLAREYYRPATFQTLSWSRESPQRIRHTLIESQGPNAPEKKSLTSLFPFLSWDIETQKIQLSGQHLSGIFRSVHHGYIAFSVCSFIDELSYIFKEDPTTFFNKHVASPRLTDQLKSVIDPGIRYQEQRLKNVIQQVKSMSNWGIKPPKNSAFGFSAYYCFNSYIAVVVQISSVNNSLKVENIWTSVDCGIAVNPDGLRAQIEGGLIFGLSASLYGQLPKNHENFDLNFDNYQVARVIDTPVITIQIEENNYLPTGAGELAVPPIAPAIANAYRKLSGKRLLSMPFMENGQINLNAFSQGH